MQPASYRTDMPATYPQLQSLDRQLALQYPKGYSIKLTSWGEHNRSGNIDSILIMCKHQNTTKIKLTLLGTTAPLGWDMLSCFHNDWQQSLTDT